MNPFLSESVTLPPAAHFSSPLTTLTTLNLSFPARTAEARGATGEFSFFWEKDEGGVDGIQVETREREKRSQQLDMTGLHTHIHTPAAPLSLSLPFTTLLNYS